MTERQRRFAEIYAACGNAAQAAREAGYSERTARSQGQRLLTNVDVIEYIRHLQNRAASARIASVTQAKGFWSDIMNNPAAKTADRLRASELLAKAAGAFLHTRPDDGGEEYTIVSGEHEGEDVIVYLPDNGRDHELQKYMDEEGNHD